MNDAKQELVSEFSNFTDLKNVGLALMDFACARYFPPHSTNNVITKDVSGVFGIERIGFKFEEWKGKFTIIIMGVSAEAVRKRAPEILRIEKVQEMELKDNEVGCACFIVSSVVHLGQAVIYMDYGYQASVEANFPFPKSTYEN